MTYSKISVELHCGPVIAEATMLDLEQRIHERVMGAALGIEIPKGAWVEINNEVQETLTPSDVEGVPV